MLVVGTFSRAVFIQLSSYYLPKMLRAVTKNAAIFEITMMVNQKLLLIVDMVLLLVTVSAEAPRKYHP